MSAAGTADSATGRSALRGLPEVVHSERIHPNPPVVREGGFPVMGVDDQNAALLRGAELQCTKADRDRAHKFITHQCRWLDDMVYRMSASAMGKTFYCDVAWAVDPWKARLVTDLVPPPGHRDAAKTGIPANCPVTQSIPDVSAYEGQGMVKARWLDMPTPVDLQVVKATRAERMREAWVLMMWRVYFGHTIIDRYQRLMTEYANAEMAYSVLPESDRQTDRGLDLAWRASVAARLRDCIAPGMPEVDEEGEEVMRPPRARRRQSRAPWVPATQDEESGVEPLISVLPAPRAASSTRIWRRSRASGGAEAGAPGASSRASTPTGDKGRGSGARAPTPRVAPGSSRQERGVAGASSRASTPIGTTPRVRGRKGDKSKGGAQSWRQSTPKGSSRSAAPTDVAPKGQGKVSTSQQHLDYLARYDGASRSAGSGKGAPRRDEESETDAGSVPPFSRKGKGGKTGRWGYSSWKG